MSDMRHFLDLDEIDTGSLRTILSGAEDLKANGHAGPPRCAGRVLAMIFEQPSTRTRVSFEVAMLQLGGHAVLIDSQSSQLGRGESAADTARVLSRYVDAIMIRAADHNSLVELAAHADVPVINGLTDRSHPCQLIADVMTFEEHRGPINGRTVAWCGEGNNVAQSWIQAAVRFDFELRLACPEGLEPAADILDWARAHQGRVGVVRDAREAVRGVDCVVTDTWVSMGADPDPGHRDRLGPYQVNAELMAAAPDAVFMHCLPAHRGDEVTADVIDGPQSVVWDEAGNRLHAQKGILQWCFG